MKFKKEIVLSLFFFLILTVSADAGIEGDFTDAVDLFNKGKYSQSLSLFQEIVKHYERIGDTDNQRYTVARYYRAKSHFHLHELEPALNDFLFVDSKNVPLYLVWQDVVKVYILMKEDRLAIHYLEKKIKTENRFDYLFELGRLYWGIEDRENAISAFENAHRIDPMDSQLLFYMSYLYWELGDMFSTGKTAQLLDEVSFDNIINLYSRGMVYFSMGLYEKAVEQFQIALNETPTDETMNSLLLVSLIKSGDLDTADILLQDLLGKNRGDSWLWFQACEIPIIKRDPYGALTVYNALDSKLQNTPQGIYLKVFELVLSGELEEAESILNQSRERNVEKPDFYPMLVALQMFLGKTGEVDITLKRFEENCGTDFPIDYALFWFLNFKGTGDVLSELSNFATRLGGDNPQADALNALVEFNIYSGRLEDAIGWIDQLIKSEPDNSKHSFTGAILSLRLGNKSAARNYLDSFTGIIERGDEWNYIREKMEFLLNE